MTAINLTTAKKYGRLAGICYLTIITCGLFSEMFVRGSLIISGNPSETVANIIESEQLFRLGFASDMAMALCDVTIGVLFYILLRPVNKTLALLAAFLRLAQTAIIGINLLHYFSAILLISNEQYINIMGAENLEAQIMLFLEMHKYGYLISGVFFGFNCLVTGYLFIKSSYFPRLLGIMLVFASVGYLVNCYANFLQPSLTEISDIILLFTAVITELSICIWLLIKGVKSA